jgi:hypothetical protein
MFPEIQPSPAARPLPLPDRGGAMPGPASGSRQASPYDGLNPDQVPPGAFDPSYFSKSFDGSQGQVAPLGSEQQQPFAGDDGAPAVDRNVAIQHAAAAIQRGADPEAVRARLNQMGHSDTGIDPPSPFSDLVPVRRQEAGNMSGPAMGSQTTIQGLQPQSMLQRYDVNGSAGQAAPKQTWRGSSYMPVSRELLKGDQAPSDQMSALAGPQSRPDARLYSAAYTQDHLESLQDRATAYEMARQRGGDREDRYRAMHNLPPLPHPTVTRPNIARPANRPPQPQPHQIGSLSERFEAGRPGNPGAINPGTGDHGGPSYGSFQLATNSGQPQAFLRSEGGRWLPEFRGASPGTSAFDSVWRAVAARDPQAFEEAQHAYIVRTHFAPIASDVLRATGLDLNSRSDAVREAAWSSTVQHGTAAAVLANAIRAADRLVPDRRSANYDEALINSIYDERIQLVRRLATNTHKYNARERQAFRNMPANRYRDERRLALQMWRVGNQ